MNLLISLFLLLTIPLIYIFSISVFFQHESGKRNFKRAFFSGMFLFVFVQVIYQLIKLFYKVNYEWFPLYLYLWATEILPYVLVLTAGYFLLVRKGVFRQDSYLEYPYVFSFTAGVLVLSGLFRSVNSLLKFDSYILFLFPFLTVSLLVIFPVIVIEAGVRRAYRKTLIYALLFPFSIILVSIPWLYYINYFFAALGATALITAGSLSAFLLLKRDYIRK